MKRLALILLLFTGLQATAQNVLNTADINRVKELFFIGLREKMNENYAKASEVFTQILNLDPTNAAVYYEIALVSYRQNKLVEAEAAVKKAVALDADNTWYAALLSTITNRNVLAMRPVNDTPPTKAPVWDYAVMASDIRQVIDVQQDFKKAIKMGDEALSVFPNQAILYYYMAFALHRDDQNTPALANLKTALQLDGENKDLQALIFALQAEIFIDEHKFGAATAAFDKAVALSPTNYRILNNYAYYLALRNQDLDKAETLIAKAAKALPGDNSVADTYAFVLLKLEKYEQAEKWIGIALKNKESNNGVYLEHYGDVLFLKGETAAGIAQWQKAREAGNDSDKLKQKIDERKYIK